MFYTIINQSINQFNAYGHKCATNYWGVERLLPTFISTLSGINAL